MLLVLCFLCPACTAPLAAICFKLATFGFELFTQLLHLSSLFRRQNGEHFLVQSKLLAHQFRLQSSFLGKFLRNQRLIERTAVGRLTQLLVLGPQLFMQRPGALAEIISDLFHPRLLIIG